MLQTVGTGIPPLESVARWGRKAVDTWLEVKARYRARLGRKQGAGNTPAGNSLALKASDDKQAPSVEHWVTDHTERQL
ncbi:MAG: hypothetical protein HY912_11130 [Desulfomonile tiedjei]|uniref:Uncharacterized protein n=1 Tax=Desulfomonile tiedjei TaxID=2358 RepID=A0A9D6V245_9BACT|nr:hypothetical protein [Desulfomonile tiedjei]